MFGYAGKILKVNLSLGEITIEDSDSNLLENFLGGRGLGVAMLSDNIKADPYSEEMPIIFCTGPLVSTGAPSSGRMSVVSRSPLTGTVFDCSVGGRFATTLKRCGFDALYIKGISRQWVSLIVEDDKVRLEPAHQWQGMNLHEIRQRMPKGYSYAAIGVAGERLVRFGSICFDGHFFAGRGGLGSVMGAKRLKFIALKGSKPVRIYDPTALREANSEIMRLLRASPAIFGEFGLSRYGTPALIDVIHVRRLEPTENFKKTYFAGSSNYSAFRLSEIFKAKKTGCMGCPVLCKKRTASGENIPEYETLSHFGALNLCSDLSIIIECSRICNDFGMDTISAGATISCYREINKLEPRPEEMPHLLRQIATRQSSLGNALAEGSYRYALSLGSPQLSMSVKGLELPAYDPRGAYGMALGYAVSNRGGCHLRSYPIGHEILRKPVATDRFSFEGKARVIKLSEDLYAIIDSLTTCKFLFFGATLEEFVKALNAVTGKNHSVQGLLRIGEKICRLERHLNNLNGFDSSHDDLPERFFKEEGSSSERLKIAPIDRTEFLKARARYYKIRGASSSGVIEEV